MSLSVPALPATFIWLHPVSFAILWEGRWCRMDCSKRNIGTTEVVG
jgi:hypothetical protein